MILGIETYICKLNSYLPTSLAMNEDVFNTMHIVMVIADDTLHYQEIDIIFHQFFTHEEVEKVLNDLHSEAYGNHLSRLVITHKILQPIYL